MSSVSSATPAAPAARNQGKFSVDKTVSGDITVLTLHGTLDHGFEGRKVAASIATRKLIVNLRDVRRFASWGMSEWMDFLGTGAERDLYIVECSAYASSQITLVTGLLGHAKLVSLYAPYRCGSCSEEFETLVLVPRDSGSMREMATGDQLCATCGGRVRLEEYPASVLTAVADRPPFDIDDEVLAYFRSRLSYDLAVDLTRLRAQRYVRGNYTYLRLQGNLATLPVEKLAGTAQGTMVVDVQRAIVDPAQTASWLAFVRAAMPQLTSLQLVDCPARFLETAVTPEDLRDKLKIRTFTLDYVCPRCRTAAPHTIDVAENLEQLVQGIAPQQTCAACRSPMPPELTPEQILRLRALPARDRDASLDAFLATARAEPQEKLEDALATVTKRPLAPANGRRWMIYAALGIAVLAGGVVIAVQRLTPPPSPAPDPRAAVIAPTQPTQPAQPAFVRPDWILSDVPSSAYCHDLVNRVMCVGVSSYRGTREEAVIEANDAALEELVSAIGLKISDPFFKDNLVSQYSQIRAKALATLQDADVDRTSAQFRAATEALDTARKRVVAVMQASGGGAVPTRRTDWYWEEYAKKGGGAEVLVFVRYDVTLDAVRTLVERYSALTPAGDASVMTAFPALAWKYSDFKGGAVVAKPGHALGDAGIAPIAIVSAVGAEAVVDGPSFAHLLHDARGPVNLTVEVDGAAPKVIELHAHAK